MSQQTQVDPTVAQRSRWCFTKNNYIANHSYRNDLLLLEHKVKRAVFGREICPTTGTPHLQGYVEFYRTVRIGHVRKIFTAHWSPARENSLLNYQYCTKENDYDVIGDFSAESNGTVQLNQKKKLATIPMILKGLLDPECALQVRVTKEYSDRHFYFDRVSNILKGAIDKQCLFDQWKGRKLYEWQYRVLHRLMGQNDRKVLWVVDRSGNSGKTFLGMYICALYNFQYLDGHISTRDLGPIIDINVSGIVFDVSRSAIQNFDYCALESLKNGTLISGKYRGTTKRWKSMKIIVFSNSFPNNAMLSEDRWDIYVLGEEDLSGNTAIISPNERYPFIKPPSLPILCEDFDLREFLETRLGEENPSGNDVSDRRTISRPSVTDPVPVPSQNGMEGSSHADMRQLPVTDRHLPAVTAAVCPRSIHPNLNLYKKGCPCTTKRSKVTKTSEVLADATAVQVTALRSGADQNESGAGPVQNESSGAGPVQNESSGAGPVQNESSGAGPVQNESSGAGPVQNESSGAGPVQTISETDSDISSEDYIIPCAQPLKRTKTSQEVRRDFFPLSSFRNRLPRIIPSSDDEFV